MIDIRNLTIKKARKHLDDKDFSARQLAEAYLEEISKVNTDLNAYLEVYKDVLEQADVADKKIAKGEISPLTGIPLAIKDNILISGKHASAGSKILKGYIGVVLQKTRLSVLQRTHLIKQE
ncbi:MAG: Glutamyl-tRNA(Gln) amidotransferase subunit A [Parcubacteria group bacterium GW2011_GWB1_40_5]|nr:MAG: Glutamyl-tRNA(Gln) amidotransferase subunit A [Parcubacteria group bacterium GW2011_GWB1_40_5]